MSLPGAGRSFCDNAGLLLRQQRLVAMTAGTEEGPPRLFPKDSLLPGGGGRMGAEERAAPFQSPSWPWAWLLPSNPSKALLTWLHTWRQIRGAKKPTQGHTAVPSRAGASLSAQHPPWGEMHLGRASGKGLPWHPALQCGSHTWQPRPWAEPSESPRWGLLAPFQGARGRYCRHPSCQLDRAPLLLMPESSPPLATGRGPVLLAALQLSEKRAGLPQVHACP